MKDENKRAQCVTTEEGNKIKEEYTFQWYIECSAKSRFKLTEVFFKAVQTHYKIMEM